MNAGMDRSAARDSSLVAFSLLNETSGNHSGDRQKRCIGVLALGANDSEKTKAEKPGKETDMELRKKGRGKGRHKGRK